MPHSPLRLPQKRAPDARSQAGGSASKGTRAVEMRPVPQTRWKRERERSRKLLQFPATSLVLRPEFQACLCANDFTIARAILAASAHDVGCCFDCNRGKRRLNLGDRLNVRCSANETKKAAQRAAFFCFYFLFLIFRVYGLSVRRFNVGRSSSLLGSA